MRLSELADATGASVATLKFYLREGLLHPGASVTRTLADYDGSHIDRVRLIRALSDTGGLSLARVHAVLRVLDDPGAGRLNVLEVAQRVLSADADVAARPGEVGGGPGVGSAPYPDTPAGRWLAALGWSINPAHPLVGEFEQAWAACEAAHLPVGEEQLAAMAAAARTMAAADLASTPGDPAGAVRHVVLGTVLLDPMLAVLRRLAQQDRAIREERERA